jgi:hypothetical protein
MFDYTKCQLCSGMFKRDETCDCSTPEGIIKRLKYKNCQILIKVEDCPVHKCEFLVCPCPPSLQQKYLQILGRVNDKVWTGRKWRLSPHMTKGEIVQTAFMACLAWEEHECREAFRYKDQPVFSPHYNIESLVRLCEQGQFEERSK